MTSFYRVRVHNQHLYVMRKGVYLIGVCYSVIAKRCRPKGRQSIEGSIVGGLLVDKDAFS